MEREYLKQKVICFKIFQAACLSVCMFTYLSERSEPCGGVRCDGEREAPVPECPWNCNYLAHDHEHSRQPSLPVRLTVRLFGTIRQILLLDVYIAVHCIFILVEFTLRGWKNRTPSAAARLVSRLSEIQESQ